MLACFIFTRTNKRMGAFKQPHGGDLKNLYLSADAASKEQDAAREYASWDLTERQLCDIELLLNGAFSPLEGFLNQADYDSVVARMRLTADVLGPMPLMLDVSEEFSSKIKSGDKVALRDLEGVVIATIEVGDIWTPNKKIEAESVYGSSDEAHPAVHYLNNIANPVYVGGKLAGMEVPKHDGFKALRDGPAEMLGRFRKVWWGRVVVGQKRHQVRRGDRG